MYAVQSHDHVLLVGFLSFFCLTLHLVISLGFTTIFITFFYFQPYKFCYRTLFHQLDLYLYILVEFLTLSTQLSSLVAIRQQRVPAPSCEELQELIQAGPEGMGKLREARGCEKLELFL
jgi:hypothetical protein